MTEKELKGLGKTDLLKLLREQELTIGSLNQQVKRLEEQVVERRLSLENAGSIAEGALQISNIFSAAQESADIYLYNIRQIEERAQKKADELMMETERKCSEREAAEKRHVDELWVSFQDKMLRFCKTYAELGELVQKINILPAIKQSDKSEIKYE